MLEYKKDKVVSRLTGEEIEVGFNRTMHEMPENNPNVKAFGIVAECLRMNVKPLDESLFEILCQRYTYPKEMLRTLFEYMAGSFDATDRYLYIVDGTDEKTLEAAWHTWNTETGAVYEKDWCPFENNKLII